MSKWNPFAKRNAKEQEAAEHLHDLDDKFNETITNWDVQHETLVKATRKIRKQLAEES